jgi:ribosomal protein L30E
MMRCGPSLELGTPNRSLALANLYTSYSMMAKTSVHHYSGTNVSRPP